MKEKRCYGTPLLNVDLKQLKGVLIVIEGMDSSGRSSQIRMLSTWLEQKGYAVLQTEFVRSKLVGPALERAKQGNILSPRTMSLFYATDFYDQLENSIIPALKAGYVVLADRYIYTLMARDIVRSTDADWVESLYSMALIPDAIYFLMATSRDLIERTLYTNTSLDYWESGMDLGISTDWYESFVSYQRHLRTQYKKLKEKYNFTLINANRSLNTIHRQIKTKVELLLSKNYK